MPNAELTPVYNLFPAKDQPLLKKILPRTSLLTTDSRLITKDAVFTAISGLTSDGHHFIPQIKNKAALIIVNQDYQPPADAKAAFIKVADTAAFIKKLAPAYYGYPSRCLNLIGITGTNGKTTISYMLENIFQSAGEKTGVIGTINIRYPGRMLPAVNTTPEVCLLQQTLANMVTAKVTTVIMEISSHALSLGRVNGLDLNTAIFTNITPEHLDFHKNMDQYLEAKLEIFDLLEKSVKKNKRAIYWQESNRVSKIENYLRGRAFKKISYGFSEPKHNSSKNYFQAVLKKSAPHGQQIRIYHRGKLLYEGLLAQAGSYNILNALTAVIAWPSTEINPDQTKQAMEIINQTTVPGRLEKVANPLGAQIIVDYAHSPDALANALSALRKSGPARLNCVFGCGGDRDRSKRPIMGQISGEKADKTYLTSDNPRTEDPRQIINDIIPGLEKSGGCYEIIENRQEAISRAVFELNKNEILLIAGKGHEDYQIIGRKKIHFDDREAVQHCFQQKD